MTAPRSPSQDVDAMMDRSAPALVEDVARMERAVLAGDYASIRDAQDAAALTIGQLLAFADLLGRRRMELIATYARRERPERTAILAAETIKFGAVPASEPLLPRVEFEQAVRDIATRMPTVERDWRRVAELYSTKHAFACARAMTKAVTDRVQTIIREAIRTGESGEDADPVSRIVEDTGWRRSYATCVYRTGAQTAYTAGIWARASHPDVMAVVPGFKFISQHLATSRPNHEACAGLIAPVNSRLWDRYSPPLGYNCLPGDVRVSGNVEGAVRSKYSGQVVELETRRGTRLRLTGNHPVLTRRGWIAANAIREGDEVFRHLPDVDALRSSDDLAPSSVEEAVRAEHNDDVPPRIEDVFDALAANGAGAGAIRARTLPLDLHGDAQFTEREVSVVRADGRLPRHVSAALFDGADDLQLVLAEAASLPGQGVGSLDALRHRPLSPSRGAPRLGAGAEDTLPVVGAVLRSRPSESLRFGKAPDRDVAPSKPKSESGSAHAEFVGQLLERLPGDVAPDHVVKVRDFHWTGHVYDLQTSEGWMVADGIVISNCVCSVDDITVYEAERQGLIRNGEMLTLLPPGFGISAHPDKGFGLGRPDRVALFGDIAGR